ncbi:BREX system ATP-binding protein BrxD [Tunturiibacter gelidoferens]|nr:BREX system ATP-binding protein BrxD [Edaphobacter lichenicola]
MAVSRQRRRETIDALRAGTVPRRGLDLLAVGMDRFTLAVDGELESVRAGSGVLKAIRGEYGSGKTFFGRWLQERAKRNGFAVAEVQISETETPLHRLETVYRRLMERLSTADQEQGAFRSIVDAWFFSLEEDLLQANGGQQLNETDLLDRTNELMEKRLASITKMAPAFAATLRAYRSALAEGQIEEAEALLSWLAGQPNVSATAKRRAGIKGNVDHFGALSFLQGLLVLLRDAGYAGLIVVLDEVETLQRVRGDVREKGLNALRQLIDEVYGGRFPGLYLLVTGTPAFFDGPQGIQRLPPLAQRLHVEFGPEDRFDNPRAVQIRLRNLNIDGLTEVGRKVRDLVAEGSHAEDRIRTLADDAFLKKLAVAMVGKLGGKVGIAPRLYLKRLVGDILDRIEQFPDFDPQKHFELTVAGAELSFEERSAASVDEIHLEL